MNDKSIIVGKLDAGRRQLATAIDLWFHGKDPVSIHTLAHAAYEIIHFISKVRNPGRRDLLLDTVLIKDEYRVQYVKKLKEPGNFFKHAKEDGETTIEFKPSLSEGFILFSIAGVELAGERPNGAESAYIWWLEMHSPDLLTDVGKDRLTNLVPRKVVDDLRGMKKGEFFDLFLRARALNGME